MQDIVIAQSNNRIIRPRELRGVSSDNIQYGLDVGWRFGDDAQDVVTGGFTLQRIGNFSVLLLHFVK